MTLELTPNERAVVTIALQELIKKLNDLGSCTDRDFTNEKKWANDVLARTEA